MRETVRVRRQADDSFRTWVHESLHARQPYGARALGEIRTHQGYEEGMVEGLARLATRVKAGMRPREASYDYYVVAYRALAASAGVDVEALWRGLWQHAPGEVREAFVRVVDTLRAGTVGEVLLPVQRGRLLAVADQLFASARKNDPPAAGAAAALWKVALK